MWWFWVMFSFNAKAQPHTLYYFSLFWFILRFYWWVMKLLGLAEKLLLGLHIFIILRLFCCGGTWLTQRYRESEKVCQRRRLLGGAWSGAKAGSENQSRRLPPRAANTHHVHPRCHPATPFRLCLSRARVQWNCKFPVFMRRDGRRNSRTMETIFCVEANGNQILSEMKSVEIFLHIW